MAKFEELGMNLEKQLLLLAKLLLSGNLAKYEEAFLSLLTTEEYNAHNITASDSNWTANSKSQVVPFQHKPTHSLRWDQQFADGVKMRLDVHPEFQTVAEVLSSRWTGCRCQNKGSLKNDFF